MSTSSLESRERSSKSSIAEFKKIWREWEDILRSVGILPPYLYQVTGRVPESTLTKLHNAVAAAESQQQYVDPLTLAERIHHDNQSLLEDEYVAQCTELSTAKTR